MNHDATQQTCRRLKACYAHLKTFKGVNLSDCGIDLQAILATYMELLKFPATMTDPLQKARWAILICDAELLLEAEYFEWVNGQAWHKRDVKAFLSLWSLGRATCESVFGKDMQRYIDRFRLAACFDPQANDDAFTDAWQRFIEYAQAYGEYEAADRIIDLLSEAVPA